jgi:hypothetical protein
MKLQHWMFLGLALLQSLSCRPAETPQAESKETEMFSARKSPLKADKEWVIYYANETIPYGKLDEGGKDEIPELLVYRAYVDALPPSEAKAYIENDLKQFPAAVAREIGQLEALICGGAQNASNTVGLLVFTNELFHRGKYRTCTQGGKLAEKDLAGLPSSKPSFPAADKDFFAAAMKAASGEIGASSNAAAALIVKSHGQNDRSLNACPLRVSEGLALTSEVSAAKLGLCETKFSSCEDQPFKPFEKHLSDHSPPVDISGPGSLSQYSKSLEISRWEARHMGDQLDLDCRSVGLADTDFEEALTRFETQIRISLVFYDWLGSAPRGSAEGRSNSRESWGIDERGIAYGAIDYGKLLLKYNVSKTCGKLHFYCGMTALLTSLSGTQI